MGGVRSGDVGFGEAELAAYDVAALGDGAGLVEGDLAIAALTSESAIAGHDELLGGNEVQGVADLAGDVFGAVGLQNAMADGSDADFLFEIVAEGSEQVEVAAVAVLHFEGPHIAAAALEIDLEIGRASW